MVQSEQEINKQHNQSEQRMQAAGLDAREGINTPLPLSALLSHVLVAFTIELDNEFEQRIPHSTTNYGRTRGTVWLTSLVMWFNCMRFVDGGGVTVSELQRLARTETNLDGMRRWGYISIEPDTTNSRSKQPRQDAMLRATAIGQQAREVWQPLFAEIEGRWRERFGAEEYDRLWEALWAIGSRFNVELPDCMPILKHGLFSHKRSGGTRGQALGTPGRQAGSSIEAAAPDRLYSLLARVLLAFAIEFERESDISLAIYANLLRVLDEQGVQLRALPELSGVSKEAISVAVGMAQERRLAMIAADAAGSRFKVVHLTGEGVQVRERSRQLLATVEERWQRRFGVEAIHALRAPLERLVGVPNAHQSPLFQALKAYPDGWRAQVRQPETLPYFPMVLHRGGFPDGS